MKTIESYKELLSFTSIPERSFLLLYKSGSAVSECALSGLREAFAPGTANVSIAVSDVTTVRDIHPNFAINSVPSLLFFEKGKHTNTVKGCLTATNFKALIENALFQANASAEGKSVKNVTVYSTPSCSWCNTLKTWLRKNGIVFTDVDVSRNQQAAHEMVQRSGQQGVPQTLINGQIVVGFNQQRLKELLEIQ